MKNGAKMKKTGSRKYNIMIIMMMMISLHCPMPRKLFTNILMLSTLQNDVEMFLPSNNSLSLS